MLQAQTVSVTFTIAFPGTQLEPSFLDLSASAASATATSYIGSVYDAWCLDRTIGISVVGSYTASVYSSYELGTFADQASLQFHGNAANLDNVNWLLNFYTGPASGYTYSEVQGAIWSLMGSNPIAAFMGAQDPAKITELVNLALAHDGFVPDAGQALGVIFDPVNASGVHQQPLIIETKAAKLGDFVWNDLNANGVQDAGEPGIAGATVQLVRDMNGDGLFTGASEVIATGITDANGGYAFKGLTPGLNYQVVVSQPAGFDAASPRQVDSNPGSGSNSDGPVSDVVVLDAGQYNTSIDAGFYKYARLGDRVWVDLNSNGVQDAGEAGLSGVSVLLLDAVGNTKGSQVTDVYGNYLFTNLVPGAYLVQFVAPGGYTLTTRDANANTADSTDSDANPITGKTDSITLASGETNLTVDAGLVPVVVPKAHIGDFVFEDKNADGVQGASEPGIAGVTVNLKDSAGNLVATTVTAGNGGYGFDVAAGTYSVQVVAPGFSVSPQGQGGNPALDSNIDSAGNTAPVTVGSGQTDNSIDAGLFRKASLGDKVWLDANGNGLQDNGENGQAGVTVNLCDAAGVIVATATTDASGNYLFSNLTPGSYSVQFVAPTGYTLTTQDANANASDTFDSDANAVTGTTGNYLLASGDNNRTVDAGLVQKAHIGDLVFEDRNANGLQDSGEAGIAGVTVTLCDAAGNRLTSTTTDSSGLYGFDVNPGTYSVKVTAPADYFITKRDAGFNDAADSDVDEVSGKTANYTLNSGDVNNTVDAGLYKKAAIGDKVWVDIDKDGVQDSNEPGVAGVKVYLLDGAGVQVGGPLTTNAAGEYLFTDLIPGSYSLRFDLATLPAGYTLTSRDAAAATDATDSDADATTGSTVTTVLDSGEVDRSWDLGIRAQVGIDIEKYVHTEYLVQTAGGGEGLTPGFWKNHTGDGAAPLSGWPETGLSPSARYETIFGVDVPGSAPSLLDALGSGSGGIAALLRHSTAALLNAANPYIDYAYTQAQIIAMVKVAFASGDFETPKNLFAAQNELGADLSTPANAVTTTMISPDVDADTVGSGPIVPVGGKAVFTYVVKNTGTTELSNIAVTDSRTASLTFVGGDTDADGRLDVNETWTYKSSETVLAGGQYASIGTVTGRDLVSGSTVSDSDATNYSTSALSQSLGNRVWFDSNANGRQDSGEAGAAGVKVTLKGAGVDGLFGTADDTAANTTTDAKGIYEFTNLNPGKYQVTVAGVTGYTFTKANAGANDAVDSDVDAAGVSPVITLGTNEHNQTVDAGLKASTATSSLGDRVWQDSNYNGLQDAGEAGIAGVTVKLLNSAGSVAATTTTNANGNYLFSGLAAGDYKVQVSTPTGYYVTKQSVGTDGALNSDINSAGLSNSVHLNSGDNHLSLDAGLYRKASVGDKVWQDANHNNVQDSGEAGIGGVTVKLMDASGTTVLATTTTSSSGNYLFSNLDPSSYVLQFDKTNVMYLNTNMSSWKWAVKDAGSNDAIDSDVTGNAIATTNVSQTSAFSLVSGQADMTRDAGITPLVIDLDHNGIHTTSLANSTGSFDLFNNGTAVKSGWISSGDGFLAVDSNGNGKIDSLSEMFGGTQAGQGFARLATYDSNHDGAVDARDAHFADLRVWQDSNGNHVTDAGELMTLAQAGVESLTVTYHMLPALDESGNLHGERSAATLAGGQSVDMTDLYFNVSAADAQAAGVSLPSFGDLLGDDRSLGHLLGGSDMASTCAVHPAEANEAMHAGDAGEVMRRLAALNPTEGHAMPA